MKRLKWVLPLIIIFVFGAGGIYFYAVSTNAESELEGERTIEMGLLENSINVGLLQYSMNENGDLIEPIAVFDVDELSANLLATIAENVQEETDVSFDTQIDFVYLDEEGNVTKNENEVRGIAFKLRLLNDKEVLNVHEHFNIEPFISSLKGANTELGYALYDAEGNEIKEKNKAKELHVWLQLNTFY